MPTLELVGKGWYTWPLIYIEGGDPQKIAAEAKAADLSHILIRIANGTTNYNVSVDLGAIIDALRSAVPEIKILAWHAVYGSYPGSEALKAIERLKSWKFDAYVADAESAWKEPGKERSVVPLIDPIRQAFPDLPIGLSSYRYPSFHREFPWKEWLEKIDFNMPQVYWLFSHNPADQLQWSYDEFKALSPNLPYYPTGAAWRQGEWRATTEEVVVFMDKARSLGITAVNFWEWWRTRYHTIEPAADNWDAVAQYSWPWKEEIPEPPPTSDLEIRLGALEDRVISLSSSWVDLAELVGDWGAELDALEVRVVALEETPSEPLPDSVGVVAEVLQKTNARFYKQTNVSGYPIMLLYPSDGSDVSDRIQYQVGDQILIDSTVVRADGGGRYHQLLGRTGAQGESLYVLKDDIVIG